MTHFKVGRVSQNCYVHSWSIHLSVVERYMSDQRPLLLSWTEWMSGAKKCGHISSVSSPLIYVIDVIDEVEEEMKQRRRRRRKIEEVEDEQGE